MNRAISVIIYLYENSEGRSQSSKDWTAFLEW